MAEKDGDLGSDGESKRLRRRKTYIQFRLPGLADELRALTAEKKNINKQLAAEAAIAPARAKELKQKKIYLKERLQILTEEKTVLAAEGKKIVVSLRSGRSKATASDSVG